MSAMTEARAIQHKRTTERQLQEFVRETALRFGWLYFHYPDAAQAVAVKSGRYDALPDKGFLDTVLVPTRPGFSIYFAECKRQNGKVTPEQQQWIDAIEQTIGIATDYVRVCVWRPSDQDDILVLLSGQDDERETAS